MAIESGRPGALDDDLIDVPMDLEDDLEVVLVDDEEPLKGQNEDQDESILEDAAPADFDDPRFQEQLSSERRQREEIERSALEAQERTEYALLNAEKRNIATQRDSFKLALDGVDVRIRTTTEALKYARQEGDVSAETDLEAQLNELRNIRVQIDNNMAKLPDERDLDAQFQQHIQARRSKYTSSRQANDAPRPLNEKAGKWQSANKWMSDPSKTKEKAALIEVNNSLVAEGYDANTDDFFSELSRRMAKRFPSLGVKNFNGAGVGQQPAKPAAQARTTPPVASSRSAAPPSPTAKSNRRVSLDAGDIRMLKMLRIDPSDKAAVQRYAKEKMSRMQSETRAR